MRVYDDLPAAVGNTPLIKLKRASEETGCTILGKAEFLNPGQSVKDRAALFIIKDALAKGEQPKTGTQEPGRHTSEPSGGVTTLKEMVDANHDYRGDW